MADAPQIDTFVTLFQFVALAIPAVAILLQVVLQVQTQYVDESGGSDITSAWEFRLIELSLIALVAGGALLSVPVLLSLPSPIAQAGVGVSVIALLTLVLAITISLRRPKYPTDNYESIEQAITARLSGLAEIESTYGIAYIITSIPVILMLVLIFVDAIYSLELRSFVSNIIGYDLIFVFSIAVGLNVMASLVSVLTTVIRFRQ
jgi:hypothetical protein